MKSTRKLTKKSLVFQLILTLTALPAYSKAASNTESKISCDLSRGQYIDIYAAIKTDLEKCRIDNAIIGMNEFKEVYNKTETCKELIELNAFIENAKRILEQNKKETCYAKKIYTEPNSSVTIIFKTPMDEDRIYNLNLPNVIPEISDIKNKQTITTNNREHIIDSKKPGLEKNLELPIQNNHN
ncbi:hypothetical protein [Nissabacter sp. SGAir0207]|uniref:hypothetical protein n=1 Tax=Nissabacter sp. SGAir0207 TaxID=2126321 RepID=UPI0010F4466D|nr:hypothetical protein [Nissabacter sp. SGAir0207]